MTLHQRYQCSAGMALVPEQLAPPIAPVTPPTVIRSVK